MENKDVFVFTFMKTQYVVKYYPAKGLYSWDGTVFHDSIGRAVDHAICDSYANS